MQVKKERMHHCGLSNVDYKRLSDAPTLKKYSDDMRTTNFGLMGRTGVPYAYQSCGFGNHDTLMIHAGFKLPEPPNPRMEETKKYYEKARKPFVLPSKVQNTRVTQLEDGVWNEKVFTGEDVGRLTWYKNNVGSPLNETVGSPAARTQGGAKGISNGII